MRIIMQIAHFCRKEKKRVISKVREKERKNFFLYQTIKILSEII